MAEEDPKQHQDLKLLLVEDNQADYVFLWELLHEINARATIEHWSFFSVAEMNTVWVQTLGEAINKLQQHSFDVILLDLSLPDSDGIESIEGIRRKNSDIPLIVLSGDSRAELTFQAVTRGAQDFLVKGQFNSDQLARSIRYAVERKRIERELDQASRHKSQFLANMSHELRTPITSILGFAEIVQEELYNHPVLGHSASAVVRNAEHLLALLDDILDYSKIEAGKLVLEKVDVPLAQIINQAGSMIELQAANKKIDFIITGVRPVPRNVITDPLRLKQILLNLLTNAIKFTERGSVTLSVDYDPLSKMLNLAVVDTGIGISEEKQKILFQPFTQADPSSARQFGGSGLGLSITRRLAGLMNGKVEMTSSEGKGSTFQFSLPVESHELISLTRALEEEATRDTSQYTKMRLHGRVLLVEDTDDSRELIKIILTRAGAVVETATNGQEAVDRATLGDFDVVLMDMHMPHMDGYQATRLLREQGFTRSIVALTARVTDDARAACRDAGCDDYISKPIKRQEFFRILFKYMQGGKVTISTRDAVVPQASGSGAVIEEDEETKKIIESYVRSLPDKIKVLQTALDTQDWAQIRNEAHKLANAEMFGFPELTQIARRMEKSAKDPQHNDVDQQLLEMKKCVEQIR